DAGVHGDLVFEVGEVVELAAELQAHGAFEDDVEAGGVAQHHAVLAADRRVDRYVAEAAQTIEARDELQASGHRQVAFYVEAVFDEEVVVLAVLARAEAEGLVRVFAD